MKTVLVVMILMVQCLYPVGAVLDAPDSSSQDFSTPWPEQRASDESVERLDDFPEQLNYSLYGFESVASRIRGKVQRCEVCHSAQMVEQNGYLPVLQGQQREYLYSKILSFKTRSDHRHPFPRYSQTLDDAEIIDIALYYALQPSRLQSRLLRIEPVWRNEPAEFENSISACLKCHGRDGNGAGLIPALSGQNAKYLSYRMREISAQSSRIHVHSDAPVTCMVEALTVRQSNQMAARFALVFDESRMVSGESLYQRWCHDCHDEPSHAPRLDAGFDWQARLASGVTSYAQDSMRRPLPVHQRHIDTSLSLNQWTDVLHYLLGKVSNSD